MAMPCAFINRSSAGDFAEFSLSLSLSVFRSCSSLIRSVLCCCSDAVRVLGVSLARLHQISQNRPFTGPIVKQMDGVQVLCDGL